MKIFKSKKLNITISGYYGFDSIGDEAVLLSILRGIEKVLPNCRVNILMKNGAIPYTVENLEISPVFRKSPFSLISALLRSRIFISGGGSLLQDSTSKKSLLYYTSIICLAKLCGCKVFIYANGLGPLKSSLLPKLALNSADLISLRDPHSFEFASIYTKNRSKLMLSADPVFSYPFDESKKPFLACLSYLSGTSYFAVSLRKCRNNSCINEEKLASTIRKLKARGATPVFVSMQDSFDLEISKRMAFLTGGIVSDVRNMDDLYVLLKGAEFAMGMRLHFLLAAVIAGTPAVALSYDQKIDSCLSYLGSASVLSAFDLSEEDIFSALKAARLFSFSPRLNEVKAKMEALSKKDIQLMLSLLTGEEIIGDTFSMEKFPADT